MTSVAVTFQDPEQQRLRLPLAATLTAPQEARQALEDLSHLDPFLSERVRHSSASESGTSKVKVLQWAHVFLGKTIANYPLSGSERGP